MSDNLQSGDTKGDALPGFIDKTDTSSVSVEQSVEETKKSIPIKKEIELMDFDQRVVSNQPPVQRYLEDLFYELEARNKPNPNKQASNLHFQSQKDKEQYFNSLFWGRDDKLEGNGYVSEDTKNEFLDGEPLGKYSILQAVSAYKYSPLQRQEITEAYKKKEQEYSASPLLDRKGLKKTKEYKDYQYLSLSDALYKKAGEESEILKSLPENASLRDAQLKFLYSLDSEKELFEKESFGIKEDFQECISMQLKASQKMPDINNMSDDDREKLARNVMQGSLFFRTPPHHSDMLGYDFTKWDEKKLNPNGLNSSFALRQELLKLDDKELLRRAEGFLNGQTVKEFKNDMMTAQVITLEEHTAEKDGGPIVEGLTGITKSAMAAGHFAYIDTYNNFANSGAIDDAFSHELAKAPGKIFHIGAVFLETLAKHIDEMGNDAYKRSMKDDTFGRIRNHTPFPKESVDKVLNEFYNSPALYADEKKIIKMNDGTNTELIGADKNTVLVNRMACKPFVGAPVSAEAAVKIIQSEKEEVPRSIFIESPNTGYPYIMVIDEKTTTEDINNLINRHEKEGKPFDALEPLQQRHRERLYEKEINESNGIIEKESYNDIMSFVSELDKEKEQPKEQENVADNLLSIDEPQKPVSTGKQTEDYENATNNVKERTNEAFSINEKHKSSQINQDAAKKYLNQRPSSTAVKPINVRES